MFKHKKNQKTQEKLTIIAVVVAVTSLLMTCVLVFMVLEMRNNLHAYGKSDMHNAIEGRYWTGRVTFCHDNNIRPCSLDKLTEWNNAHPDDTFNVVPPARDW